MNTIEELIQRARKTQHGFKDIQEAADETVAFRSEKESFRLAKQLFASDIHQARCLAVFIFGRLAAESYESLEWLKLRVSRDSDWRVQEILAKSFDRYCADTDYEKALPVIKEWLSDPSHNVRRAVTEGLRIWTNRPYFSNNPDIAIRLLRRFRNDESEYVRKSAGNALRDISRKHPGLVRAELQQWDLSDKLVWQTFTLASKFLSKEDVGF
jgi:3-methyladenine DNA glycosylase AlkC